MSVRSLVGDYRASLANPAFWIYSTWLELATKYRRSRLGIAWALAPPVLYTFGVGIFYAKLQGLSLAEFLPHLGIGYIVFRLVVVTISESTTACTSHANFILDGRVRLTDYVLRVIAKAFFYFLLSIPVVSVAVALGGEVHFVGLLTAVPALALVLVNVAWCSVIFAILGARLQDVGQLVGSALMFAFLLTPILWQASLTPYGTLRGSIARANPIFHFVEIVRAPILGEPLEIFSLYYVVVLALLGWALAADIYRRYARFVPLWV